MNKRSAIAISGAMVLALLAGMVGANRAAIQAATAQPVVVQQAAAPASHPAFTERE